MIISDSMSLMTLFSHCRTFWGNISRIVIYTKGGKGVTIEKKCHKCRSVIRKTEMVNINAGRKNRGLCPTPGRNDYHSLAGKRKIEATNAILLH